MYSIKDAVEPEMRECCPSWVPATAVYRPSPKAKPALAVIKNTAVIKNFIAKPFYLFD